MTARQREANLGSSKKTKVDCTSVTTAATGQNINQGFDAMSKQSMMVSCTDVITAALVQVTSKD